MIFARLIIRTRFIVTVAVTAAAAAAAASRVTVAHANMSGRGDVISGVSFFAACTYHRARGGGRRRGGGGGGGISGEREREKEIALTRLRLSQSRRCVRIRRRVYILRGGSTHMRTHSYNESYIYTGRGVRFRRTSIETSPIATAVLATPCVIAIRRETRHRTRAIAHTWTGTWSRKYPHTEDNVSE